MQTERPLETPTYEVRRSCRQRAAKRQHRSVARLRAELSPNVGTRDIDGRSGWLVAEHQHTVRGAVAGRPAVKRRHAMRDAIVNRSLLKRQWTAGSERCAGCNRRGGWREQPVRTKPDCWRMQSPYTPCPISPCYDEARADLRVEAKRREDLGSISESRRIGVKSDLDLRFQRVGCGRARGVAAQRVALLVRREALQRLNLNVV